MVKVSVIIPVYNVEQYLKECLDSVINQTLKDIEIICINDGSTDGSLKILEKYESLDDRIVVFSQENSGLSATRNKGMQLSSGEYVYFMDSDDYLELNALEELYNLSDEKNLDLVIFKLINFDDGADKKYTSAYYEMEDIEEIVGDDVFNYEILGDKVFSMAVSAPGKFFKKSLIKDFKFPEGLIFEDNLFFTEAIFNAKRVYFYKKHLYNRRRRLNSITTSPNEKYMDCIPLFNMINGFMKDKGLFDKYKSPLYNQKISITYNRFASVNNEVKKEFFKRIKQDFLLYKDEFEGDEDFLKVLSFKSKCIFYSAISSQTYKEFENEVELSLSKKRMKKLKKENKTLRKKNKSLKKEIEHFKSSKAYRFWIFYKKIKN